MPEHNRFARDVGVSGLAQAAMALRAVAILPLITRFLGSTGYGLWAQVVATLGIAEPLFEMGLANSLVRFLAAEEDKDVLREGFYSVLAAVLAMAAVLTVALFGLAEPMTRSIFREGDAEMVRLAALVIPFAAVQVVCLGYFRAVRRIQTYAVMSLVRSFGEIGLVLAFVAAGFGVNGAVAALLAAAGVAGFVSLSIVVRDLGFKRPDFHLLRPYLEFGLPIVPTTASLWVVQFSGRWIIGAFRGAGEVGVFAAGYVIGSFLTFLRVPLVRILSPTISRMYDQDRTDEVSEFLKDCLKYSLMLAAPITVGLSLLARPLLELFTIPEIAAEAYPVVPFVTAAMLLYQVYAIFGAEVLKVAKHTTALTVTWIIAAAANLAVNLTFVANHGVIAAAVAALVAYALATVIAIYRASSLLPLRVDWPALGKTLAASGVMAAVLLPTRTTGWNVLLLVIIGAISYAAALFALRGWGGAEVRFLLSLGKGTETENPSPTADQSKR